MFSCPVSLRCKDTKFLSEIQIFGQLFALRRVKKMYRASVASERSHFSTGKVPVLNVNIACFALWKWHFPDAIVALFTEIPIICFIFLISKNFENFYLDSEYATHDAEYATYNSVYVTEKFVRATHRFVHAVYRIVRGVFVFSFMVLSVLGH